MVEEIWMIIFSFMSDEDKFFLKPTFTKYKNKNFLIKDKFHERYQLDVYFRDYKEYLNIDCFKIFFTFNLNYFKDFVFEISDKEDRKKLTIFVLQEGKLKFFEKYLSNILDEDTVQQYKNTRKSKTRYRYLIPRIMI